jgi:hypothetical protein
MSGLILGAGLLSAVLGIIFVIYMVNEVFGFIFRPKANKALKLLKQEFQNGDAEVSFTEGPSACETRCKVKYSLGWYATEQHGPGSSFAFAWNGDISQKLTLGDTIWLMKKTHRWAQEHHSR